MSKFNLTSLLNGAADDGERGETPRRPVLKVVSLNVRDLTPSKGNFYATDDIEQLKNSIEMFGVKQNLTVKPQEGGKYEIISGHRRRLACLALLAEGKTEFEYVPCGIEPERDELRERLLLIMTNSTTRELSDWERMKQAEELRTLFAEFKKRENLPGRVRDMIADALGTSAANVGRMDAISHNLTPEFQEEFKDGNVGISTAYGLSGLPEAEQKAAFGDYQKSGGASLKAVKERKKAVTPPAPQSEPAPPDETPPEERTTDSVEQTELSPCPFCGGRAVLSGATTERFGSGNRVYCMSCRAEVRRDTDGEAATAWNKRAR